MITAFPAALEAWTACPRRYRFAYVERRPPTHRGGWAHTTLGAATHAALARWWRLDPAERTPQRVASVVDEVWTDDGFADEAMSARWRGRARTMVADYVEVETSRRAVLEAVGMGEPRRVETVVGVRASDDVALMGKPDRVDERPAAAGSELVVVDYKTTRRPPESDDVRVSRTLAVYAAAAESTLGRPATRVELHHLPTGRVGIWRHDEESRGRHVRRAAGVARDCRRAEDEVAAGAPPDEVFPAAPGRLCPWCDYREACPEGMAVGPAAKPWEALERMSDEEHAGPPAG